MTSVPDKRGRGRPFCLTNEEREQIIVKWSENVSICQIMRDLDRGSSTISSEIDRLISLLIIKPRAPISGKGYPSVKPFLRESTDTDRAKAVRLHADGIAPAAICRKLNLHPIQVAVFCGTELPQGPHMDPMFAERMHRMDMNRAGFRWPSVIISPNDPDEQPATYYPALAARSYMGSPGAMAEDNSW